MLTERITVHAQNHQPVADATVALVASNGTFITTTSGADGVAELALPDDRVGTLFVAHPEYKAMLMKDYLPQGARQIRVHNEHQAGSVIIFSAGHIPGLLGRLNPILDTYLRTYIYGENISFNDQPGQPYWFERDVPFIAEDAMRHRYKVVVLDMNGSVSLIEYTHQKTHTHS